MGQGFNIRQRRRRAAVTPATRAIRHSASIPNAGRSSAFSRLNSPEFCLVAPPSQSQEGTGRPGADIAPAVRCAKCTRRKNRTAAYRWCRSLGLPCAMVGRLMPRSPGSRVPSGLPRSCEIHRPSHRLTREPPPQELDRSNDGQDHTVLPYARPAISPQYFQPRRRSRKLTNETRPSSAVRPRAAASSPGTTLPARTFRARRCRVHRKPGSRSRRRRDRPSR
ncbi:hypothetical protein ABIA03_004850 [Bradyrhizobium yuanmingense]|uniref:Uncharacterized protein n=1 Tax=Bradyrhizobium yuanmingense TaxID=108015 RepID=A0ABV4GBE7_9BRAD